LHLISILSEEMEQLKNKCKYINEVLNDTLDLRKKSYSQITDLLTTKKYIQINDNYNYLIKMTMDSVCQENIDSLNKQLNAKIASYEQLMNTDNKGIWKKELDELKKCL